MRLILVFMPHLHPIGNITNTHDTFKCFYFIDQRINSTCCINKCMLCFVLNSVSVCQAIMLYSCPCKIHYYLALSMQLYHFHIHLQQTRFLAHT